MLDELRGIYYTLFLMKPTKQWLNYVAVSIVALITVSVSYSLTTLALATKDPVITLYAPARNAQTQETTVNIVGKVIPFESAVVINGEKTTVNAKGTFSYHMPLLPGENKYTIKATYLWRQAEYHQKIALIEDIPPKALAKLSEPQSAYTPPPKVLGRLKRTEEEERLLRQSMILYSEEVKKDQSTIIRGRMQNKTDETIGWVKITVNFKNGAGEVIDTQISYVTNADQYLAPEALMPFVMPITNAEYSSYDLELEYDSMG